MITYQLVNSNLFKLKPLDQEIICEEIEEIVLASGLDPSKRMTLRTKKRVLSAFKEAERKRSFRNNLLALERTALIRNSSKQASELE